LAFSVSSLASQQTDPAWTNLLYYKNGKSEIDSKNFFLSKVGHKNPQSELDANLKAFFESSLESIDDAHPVCQFPARFYHLNKKYNKKQGAKLLNCSKLQDFYTRIYPNRVSVVFASYYMGNPSSTFGHTFLKLSKKKYSEDQEKDPLLSYAVNYAADVDTENGFLYAVKGLFGFFKGTYTLLPYYFKVREYNDSESRDLWIYDLNFDEEEMKLLTYHFWELKKEFSNYYFLSKNCSYFILKTIEAIKPSAKLTERLSWHVIPSDTIRALNKDSSLIKKVHYRPSTKSRLDFRVKNLNRKQKNKILKTVNQLDSGKSKSDLKSKEESDAAIELYDFMYSKKMVQNEDLFLKKKFPLLINRSQFSEPSSKISNNLKPPHKMHPSSYFSAGYTYEDDLDKWFNISSRTAFHSLIEPSDGVMPDGEISLLNWQLGLRQRDNRYTLKLHNADWIKVVNLAPVKFYQPPVSWKMHLGSHRRLNGKERLEHFIKFSGGLSLALKNNSRVYLMSLTRPLYTKEFDDKFLYDLGLEAGIKWQWTKQIHSHLQLEYFARNSIDQSFDLNNDLYRGLFESQWTLNGYAFKATFKNHNKQYSSEVGFVSYF